MNRTLPLRLPALTATILLLLLFTGRKAAAVDALLLQDTYVDTARATTNFGTSGDLRVFKSSTGSMRAFLKFSTATLPAGTAAADVKQARLRLWVNSSSTITGAITLTPVTSAWSESTLTNNTSASLTFGLPKYVNLPISSTGNFVSIDVTAWVQAWLAGTLANQGFQIDTGTTSSTLNLFFDSKESSLTSHEPQLDIVLVGPAGPAGSPGPQGSTGPQGSQGLTGATGGTGATGPQGALGPVGPIGPQGLQGPQGVTGANGTKWYSWTGAPGQTLGALNDYYLDLATGDVWQKLSNQGGPMWALQGNIHGAQGAAGPQGPAGATGVTGPQGPIGPKGDRGDVGAIGPQGVTGAPGAAGAVGATGPTGSMGVRGSAVLSGTELPPDDQLTGQDGDFYINTQYGNLYGPKSNGAWGYAIGTLYGRNGSEWHWGAGIPNPELGVYGDFYLQSTTGDVFTRWGEGGTWYNIANIRGPAGAAGPKGDSGEPGALGPQGPAGPSGLAGSSGPPGPQGPSGSAGDMGPAGPVGPQGPAGVTPTHIQPQGDLSMGEFTQGQTP
jgi:collagen triple helix repeat protein